MKNTLPIAYLEKGKLVLTEPYDYDNRITCELIGEMSDGTKVWEDNNGKQYTKNLFYGKYYFFAL